MSIAVLSKRNLIMRPYQVPAAVYAINNERVVLALCPGAGKTEISIEVISNILKLNPNWRVLILTHSTNVLKDNYTERLDGVNVEFKYSTTFEEDAQVHVCLPNSEHLIKGKYDFLIVDEAHENYLATRVQRIVKKISPKKELLLTGTPSKFIKKGGYNIFTVATNQISEEYFAKLSIELVASAYNWKDVFNKELEVKGEYKFSKDDTRKTLENVILSLIERVKLGLSPEEFNNPKFITKLKSWAFTYKSLGRTMIVCRSIKQAEHTHEILVSNGVISAVSNSETDFESEEIANFKKGKYDVLVVVDRARLGYSDDGLYNIIDMSGTHNPNMIYQIFSRCLRGTPDMHKFYLKVTTQEYGMMDFTRACVCAALMLTDEKYLSTFNGDNFKGIKIPVLKKEKTPNNSTEAHDGSGGKKNKNQKFIFPEFTTDVIDMFRNIIHNLDSPVSIYKTVTISEVRTILTGRRVWTEEEIWASARGGVYKTSGEWKKADPSAYATAQARGMLDKICEHFGWEKHNSTGYWTLERCKEDALKYTTRYEWQKAKQSGYHKAKTNKWLDECCKHMKQVNSPEWTFKACMDVAKKYKKRSDWKKNSSASYAAALREGWFELCTKHMVKHGNIKQF